MSEPIAQQVPAADGIVATLVPYAYEPFPSELLAQGSPVSLSAMPLVCGYGVQARDESGLVLGALPCWLGVVLAEQLRCGLEVDCCVESSAEDDFGCISVQVRLAVRVSDESGCRGAYCEVARRLRGDSDE